MTIDWDAPARNLAALEYLLRTAGLDPREVMLVVAIASKGRPVLLGEQRCSSLQIAKNKSRPATGLAPTTLLRTAARLQRRGLLDVATVVSPHVYVVCWDRVARLEAVGDLDPLSGMGLFAAFNPSEIRSAPVRPGPPRSAPGPIAHDSMSTKKISSHDHDLAPAPMIMSNADREDTIRFVVEHEMPWQAVDDDLLRTLDSKLIVRLFNEAVKLKWGGLSDDRESIQTFLALCHHAATSTGIRSPVAVIKSRVLRGDYTGLRDASHEWAKRKLQRSDRARLAAAGTANSVVSDPTNSAEASHGMS